MSYDYRRRELQAFDAVERSYKVQTDLENTSIFCPTWNRTKSWTLIHPGPLITSFCLLNVYIMKPCQYIDTQRTAVFSKIKGLTPKRNLHQPTRIMGHVVRPTKHEKFVCWMQYIKMQMAYAVTQYTVWKGVLSFQNAIWFQGAPVKMISLSPAKFGLPCSMFTKLTNAQHNCQQICCS
jgi:hypothetical protein